MSESNETTFATASTDSIPIDNTNAPVPAGSNGYTLDPAAGGEGYVGVETAKWTRHLPEAFGIRKAIQGSKYRWCAREAGMWAIATATAMTLHRFRMQSPIGFAVNVGFFTLMSVNFGSYYYCVRRRDYQEQTIEMLMKYNEFLTADQMPEQVPIDDDHPFVQSAREGSPGLPEQQYIVNMPERKEWQPPLPTQDAGDVFQPNNPK